MINVAVIVAVCLFASGRDPYKRDTVPWFGKGWDSRRSEQQFNANAYAIAQLEKEIASLRAKLTKPFEDAEEMETLRTKAKTQLDRITADLEHARSNELDEVEEMMGRVSRYQDKRTARLEDIRNSLEPKVWRANWMRNANEKFKNEHFGQ